MTCSEVRVEGRDLHAIMRSITYHLEERSRTLCGDQAAALLNIAANLAGIVSNKCTDITIKQVLRSVRFRRLL